MSLTIGELVGFIDLEDKGFAGGLADAARDMSQLQSKTSGTMSSVEATVVKSFAEIEQAIADGLDPASAIADLDRLDAALDASLDEMLEEADRFAAELDAAIDEAFDRLDDDAQEAGRRAGDELVDGLRGELDEAERIARREGEDAGDGFGDGVEDAGGGRMSGVGQSLMSGLKTAGIGLAVAAGAAIGAALMEGLQSALDAEDAKAKLFAQLGATGKQSEKLGRAAGELYAQAYGDSMGDVTEALSAVGSTIVNLDKVSQSSLQSITGKAMDLAKVFDLDVSNAVASVGIMLKTGMARNAAEAFDLITVSLQKVPAAVREDLLEAADEYSVFFQGLGISGREGFGILAEAAKGGKIQLDKAGDALKEFRIRSVDMSATSVAAYKAIGLDAQDMAKKILAGGPTAKKAFQQILDGILSIKDPIKQEQAAVALFGTQFEDLGNIDALAALRPITNALTDVKGAAQGVGDVLHDTASNKIEEFKRGLTTGLVDFLGGTVLPGIEDFVTRVQEDFSFLDVLARAQEFAAELKVTWDQIVTDVRAWVEDNKTTIDDWGARLEEGLTSASEVVSTVLDSLKELWAEYGDEIIVSVTFLVDTFLNVWNAFWGLVSGIFKTVKGLLTGDMGELKAGLSEIWGALWGLLKNTLLTALKGITGLMGESWDDMQAKAKDAWQKMVAAITSKVSETIAAVQQLPGKLKTVFANAGTWLLQAGRDVIQGLINGIRSMAQEAVNTITGIATNLSTAVRVAIDSHSPSKVFHKIGEDTMQGWINGLKSKDGDIKATIEKMVEDIKKAFKGKPDTVDHLLEFVKTGNKNLEDLALQRQAIVQKLADAKEYALKVAGSAQDFASLGNLKLEEGAGGSDIASGLKSKAQAIKEFAADIQALAKRGLNKATLQQIIDAGVEKGASFAEMLVGSDGAEIKAINKAQKQIDAASKKLGKTSADALYDVGKKAGDGYLKGLQESLKDLDKEMSKVAKALVVALKKELKIKSPSQVMAEIGEYTVAGLIQGIQAREGDAVDAMTGLIGKAISATAGTAGSVGKAASTTKIPINNGSMIGSNAGGFESVHEAGAASGTWGAGQGGVNITMNGVTVHEEADIPRLGAEMGSQYYLRGNT